MEWEKDAGKKKFFLGSRKFRMSSPGVQETCLKWYTLHSAPYYYTVIMYVSNLKSVAWYGFSLILNIYFTLNLNDDKLPPGDVASFQTENVPPTKPFSLNWCLWCGKSLAYQPFIR